MKLTDPQVTTFPALDGNWVLTADFHYEGHGVKLTIPRGFVTDLASIPRFLWRVIAPFELSLTAPIVHDFLYRGGPFTLVGDLGRFHPGFGREQVDALFLSLMQDEGVSWWRRELAYHGVRAFGSSSWQAQRVQVIALEGE